MKRSFLIVISCFIFTFLTACADIKQQIEEIAGQIDPQVIQDINDYLLEQGIDPEELAARANIIARAQVWLELRVPYDQGIYRDGYRTDCSGFVSYAWELKNNDSDISATTVSLGDTYGTDIYIENIEPGDILNNKRPGNSGHTVLFIRWKDDTQTKFIAYEENGGYGKTVQSTLTLKYLDDGSFTIEEYDDKAPGPYFAQKSPNLP